MEMARTEMAAAGGGGGGGADGVVAVAQEDKNVVFRGKKDALQAGGALDALLPKSPPSFKHQPPLRPQIWAEMSQR